MSEVVIVGAGLAGLAAGLRLAMADVPVHVLEAKPYVGGRTASWDEKGMQVESGLHRYVGIYSALPKLMQDAGLEGQALCQNLRSLRVCETAVSAPHHKPDRRHAHL